MREVFHEGTDDLQLFVDRRISPLKENSRRRDLDRRDGFDVPTGTLSEVVYNTTFAGRDEDLGGNVFNDNGFLQLERQ